MPNTSNLYAEQIYAEHPIALWTMDDSVDYISLINETNRDLTNWYIQDHPYSGGKIFTATNYTNSVNQPFPNSKTTKISRIYDYPSSGYLYDTNTISLNGNPISIGFWIYCGDPNTGAFNPNITSIDIGYKIGSTIVSKNVIPASYNGWTFVSAEFYSTTISSSAIIYIAFNFSNYAIDTYLINGLSIGYGAQEFNKSSLGVSIDKIADITSLSTYSLNPIYGYTGQINYGVKTDSYGFSNTPAYYVYDSASASLQAKVNMTPLVYGSSNSTMLNYGLVSMIFPSFGFLNSNGKNKIYTLETWIKINNEKWAAESDVYSDAKIRIIGQAGLGSTDGLYVLGNSIELKIGNKKKSFFIGYHNRVLLLHIVYTNKYAKVLINGETVINMQLEESDVNLLTSTVDWISFGSWIESQIDCVAMYDYEISEIQAKRHFVLGQGVQYPEIINTRYSGKAAVIDFDFAGYSNNISYPKISKWETGQFENIVVENDVLKFPNYSLPSLIFDNKDSSSWYADNKTACSVSLTYTNVNINLRPDSNWSNTNGYLYYSAMNFTKNITKGFYALIRHSTTANEQIVFKFVDKNNSNYFQISVNGDTVYYKFKYNDSEITITSHTISYATFYYSPPTVNYALVGIDIDTFATKYNTDISTFFTNQEQLSVFVGGDSTFTKTFTQPIESINFASRTCIDTKFFGAYGNSFTLSTYVNSNGIFNISTQAQYTNISSYGINPTYRLNFDFYNTSFNIACGGYWKTAIPLSYFGSYVTNASGEQDFVLDFMQFNIDSPKSLNVVNGTSQYYDDKATTVKSYINFQKLNEGVTNNNSHYTIFSSGGTPISNVVIPYAVPSSEHFLAKMYQIGDDVLVYSPRDNGIAAPDFTELAIVVYLQFDTDSIFTNPAKVRYLEISPKSLNTDTTLKNPIKTKLGLDIIPYTYSLSGATKVYDYKKINPYIITKTSNPHLFLNRQTGLTLAGLSSIGYDYIYPSGTYKRGFAINVNESQNSQFNIDSIQISINPQMTYALDISPMLAFPTKDNAVKIFELENAQKTISFYLASSYNNDTISSNRGKIYAVDSLTGNIDENISYYWNGIAVKNPYVYPNRWGILGINFTQPISFNNTVGQFRIVGPITFNNFSYYQYSDSALSQSYIARSWSTLNTSLWSLWSSSYIWDDLLKMSNLNSPAVNLQNLYQMYTGSNRYTTEFDGTRLLGISNANNKFVADLIAQSGILSPT